MTAAERMRKWRADPANAAKEREHRKAWKPYRKPHSEIRQAARLLFEKWKVSYLANRKYHRAYGRALQAKRLLAGLCTHCGGPRLQGPLNSCEPCRAIWKLERAASRARTAQ